MFDKLGMPERLGIALGLIIVCIVAALAFMGWAGWLLFMLAVVWVLSFTAHSWFVGYRKTVADMVPDSYAEARNFAESLIGQAEVAAREIRADVKSLGKRAAAVIDDAETDAKMGWAKVQAAYTEQINPTPLPPAAVTAPITTETTPNG